MSLAELAPERRIILCDVWGCIHDGIAVFPEARALLARWRDQGRTVVLLTNAPRPAAFVEAQLARLGLPRDAYAAVVTSGDAGLAALAAEGITTAGLIGNAGDRAMLEGEGLAIVPDPGAGAILCIGPDDRRDAAADYDARLADLARRGAWMLCLNPDRLVLRGGVPEICAGAIAERYEAIGGRVSWFGKPDAPIYARALDVAARAAGRAIDRAEVVAVGDGLATDILGAMRNGLDFVFVSGGIEGARIGAGGADALLARFAADQGLDAPKPLAIVPHLA